jgi:dihydrodipicolinate synthase/N-acetylneuraminate lyase
MKPLNCNDIRGNWATLLLPIKENDEIDYKGLEADIDYLTSIRLDGIYSNGTAGEFHSQDDYEYMRINELLSSYCEKRQVPYQIGASQMSPQLSIIRIKWAVKYHPSAIQVILGDWFPLQDDEVIDCLKRFAEAADGIGLVLYNPPHAKRKLSPSMLKRICDEVPQVVGVKVAGGDEEWYEAMRPLMSRLSIFVPGHLLATGVKQGAHGAYSNVACISPLGAQNWTNLMNDQLNQALELETRIQAFMKQYIQPYISEKGYCNAACDKLLAAIGGWGHTTTRLRWPYRSIPSSDVLPLQSIAQKMIPEMINSSTI